MRKRKAICLSQRYSAPLETEKVPLLTSNLPAGLALLALLGMLLSLGGCASGYTWSSVSSGALATDLSLSSSGLISASLRPELANANVQMETAAPSTASPYTSRTDFSLILLPVPLPSVGGDTGAGNCITEPGYRNLVCRATDIKTLGSTANVNLQNFSSCCGGWGDYNAWNKTSTMFFASTNGGSMVVMRFNPATRAIRPLYGKPLQQAMWSYLNADLAYTLMNGRDPILGSMTFSSETEAPRAVTIANLATAPNCVAALAGKTGWRELSVSHDDQTFLIGAGTGAHNSAIYAIVYNRTRGCRWYNTQTGEIGGHYGPVGHATTRDSYTLHSLRISGDGLTVLLTPARGSKYRHFWKADSLEVEAPHNNVNTGHFATGYAGMINTAGRTANDVWCKLGMAYRSFAGLSDPNYIIPTLGQCGDTELSGDDHTSWNNDDTADNQPFFTSTVTTPLGTLITSAWQNEILGFSRTDPGKVWRFLSSYNTGTSPFFNCQNSIGTVSQDGKWFMFTSDWGNTLGFDSAGKHRCDVFIGQLR